MARRRRASEFRLFRRPPPTEPPAAPKRRPPPDGGTTSSGDSELRIAVDDVRSRSEEWRDVLIDVIAAAGETENRDAKLTRALASAERVRSSLDADAVETELRAHLDADRQLAAGVLPHVNKLVSDISQARDWWPDPTDLEGAATSAARALEELQDIALQAAYIVIPHRVHEHLSNRETGDSFEFWEEFKDELATESQGDEVLEWLRGSPRAAQMLVDTDEGVIYKIPSGPKRWLMASAAAWGVGGGLVVVLLVSKLGDWLGVPDSDWPFSDAGDMRGLYACILIGTALHFLASLAKNIDFDGELAVTSVGKPLDWLAIRWGSILSLLLPPLITTIALGMTELRPNSFEDFATIVLAGYSADSLAPIFMRRLGNSADKTAEALTKKKSKRREDSKKRKRNRRGRDEEQHRRRRQRNDARH